MYSSCWLSNSSRYSSWLFVRLFISFVENVALLSSDLMGGGEGMVGSDVLVGAGVGVDVVG